MYKSLVGIQGRGLGQRCKFGHHYLINILKKSNRGECKDGKEKISQIELRGILFYRVSVRDEEPAKESE